MCRALPPTGCSCAGAPGLAALGLLIFGGRLRRRRSRGAPELAARR
ncbi:MAG: hypothetical protein IAE78_29580 [Myxococcus sp.]|nr:hypothetical protein [Myxococcus sp.]